MEQPMYGSVQQAADIAGVPYELIAQMASRKADPLPHIKRGKKRLIRVSALAEWLRKEES